MTEIIPFKPAAVPDIPSSPVLNFNQAGVGVMLRPLQRWLQDPDVAEILMNRPGQVYIDKQGRMTAYEVAVLDDRYVQTLCHVIAKANQQVINPTQPILYGSLSDGTRVTLVYPNTAQQVTLSFRRNGVKTLSREAYLAQGFYRNTRILRDLDHPSALLNQAERHLIRQYQALADRTDQHDAVMQQAIDDFIVAAIRARKNIVLSGGTSSGKTTYLNRLIALMGAEDRIITLEDTRELNVPQDNHVSLLAGKVGDGQDSRDITMQALVKACLRLRPDRIIMGEIRGAEIMNFCSAANTGHNGSVTTIHADDPRSAFQQMATYYKYNTVVMSDEDIMRTLRSVVDVIIQLNRRDEGRMADMIWYRHGNLTLSED